jgi:tetratricopeptide (TPR) repeat protein
MARLKKAFAATLMTVVLCMSVAAHADDMAAAIAALEQRWVQLRYHTPDEDTKLAGGQAMTVEAEALAARFPGRVEPLVWQALAILIEPEVNQDISALGVVKRAKALLEKAQEVDPSGMAGLVHATLGTLYYEVPGWPIGFGDNKKAEAYLLQALEINPDGMDTNYFYGDFLLQRGKGREAVPYLEKAMNTPLRPGHEAADTARRGDIQEALDKARKAR